MGKSVGRGCLMTAILFIGLIAACLLFLNAGTSDDGSGTFKCIIAVIVLAVSIFLGVKTKKLGRISMKSWLDIRNNCQYKHAYDGTGMAVDTVNSKLFLIMYKNKIPYEKSYSFRDVKSWKYHIPGSVDYDPRGRTTAGKLGAGTGTAILNLHLEESTGFTVNVKDVNDPDWFIKFEKTKTVETELERWMEIFSQYVNEDTPETGTVQQKNSKYCPNCGKQVDAQVAFCASCGSKL